MLDILNKKLYVFFIGDILLAPYVKHSRKAADRRGKGIAVNGCRG